MNNSQIETMLSKLVEQQQKLEAQLSGLAEYVQHPRLDNEHKSLQKPHKDGWDRTAALAPIISAVVIALIGAYFTVSYNQQQLKLQEIQTIERFIPHLTGSEQSKRAAILAIQSLGNTQLATKVASIFASEGTVSALQSIAKTGDSKEKELVSSALAKALDILADKYADENNYSQAVDKYTQALVVKNSVSPSDHPGIIDDLEKLANVYDSQGDKGMAKELRKRVLAMRSHLASNQSTGAEQCGANTQLSSDGKPGTGSGGMSNSNEAVGNTSNKGTDQNVLDAGNGLVPQDGSRQALQSSAIEERAASRRADIATTRNQSTQ